MKDLTPGKVYGNVKTTRVLISGGNITIENILIFIENILYNNAIELPSRIKDTNHVLDIIDK